MVGDKSEESFGCERCWPDNADAAWEARSSFIRETELIDESHLHVMILSCRNCSQRFVSIFTEMIDWADGDDPQYWMLLPITPEETADLVGRGTSLTEERLNELGRDRRSLRRDRPKMKVPSSYWGTGIWVGPHD